LLPRPALEVLEPHALLVVAQQRELVEAGGERWRLAPLALVVASDAPRRHGRVRPAEEPGVLVVVDELRERAPGDRGLARVVVQGRAARAPREAGPAAAGLAWPRACRRG